MKKSQKTFILIIVILFLGYLAYSVYFTSKEGMGSFNDFDINSTASKNIKVELVQEKGVTPNQDGGVTFFVKDKNGVEKKVMLVKELPAGINNTKTMTLTGHLHADYFHATEADPD
ncbi:MAG TPA: hypothetical protein VGK25_12615 [Ignavibacteria bacterium]